MTGMGTHPWRLSLLRQTNAAELLDMRQIHTVALFTAAFDTVNNDKTTKEIQRKT